MTRNSLSSPHRILIGFALISLALTARGQAGCVFTSYDDFNSETTSVPLCGVTYTTVTENWSNLMDVDETDWIPWQGPTPTGATGPYAVPPVDLEVIYDVGNPIFVGDIEGIRAAEHAREDARQFDPGTYLYVESTDCCGNRAILESDTLDFSTHTVVGMVFAYHMYGANMGSLTLEVSVDGGEQWATMWSRPHPGTGWNSAAAAGLDWQLGGADLSAELAGQPECLIRLTAEVGLGGERSDIAIDNLLVLGFEPFPTVHNEGTFAYAEIPSECRFRVTYDQPSDFCTSVDHRLQEAELRMSLNMGDIHRYGGTDLDGGVTLIYDIGDGSKSYHTTDTLTIANSSQPEELVIHDIRDFIDDGQTSIDVYVTSLTVGENPDYPEFVDDVQLDVAVHIEEDIDARGETVSLSAPSTPAQGGFTHFQWSSASGECAFPTYRFQLLRLHDFTDGAPVRSKMDESVWERSALTLEVGEPEVELSMMEGSGYYAWRVMPIGNRFPGGAGNDMNWGEYSGFAGYSTSHNHLQTIGANPEPGVFQHDDPDEDKNRTFERAFSRNLTESGEALVVGESVMFASGSGFGQQTQALSRSRGVAVAQNQVRSYGGMTPLSVMPIPIEKQDLNFEPGLLRSTDNSEYTAHDFDSGTRFQEPLPMSTSTSASPSAGVYWSDENPNPRIPSAEGYPFSAVETTRDGLNRPLARGANGHVLRLKPGGYTTRIKYGSVTDEELIRVFGNEAPNPKKVEKVITISPENVTQVAYIDLHGRTLATCLASNPLVDENKIGTLAPENGFTVTNGITSAGGGELYEALTEISLEESMVLELDFDLAGAAFQSACQTFCRTCDYRVDIQVVNLDNNHEEFSHTLTVGQQTCDGGDPDALTLNSLNWTSDVPVPAGRFAVSYAIRLNTEGLSGRYLDVARAELETQVGAEIDATSAPLLEVLQDILDEGGSISEFYLLCDSLAAASNDVHAVDVNGDGRVDHYRFDVGSDALGTAACDQIRIEADTCRYDCHPDTRDFEAFVTDVATSALRDRLENGNAYLLPDEALDAQPYCNSSGYMGGNSPCFDLSEARGWVPLLPALGSYDWDHPRNVAAINYGVSDGQFNEVMEHLLAEHDADPIRYKSYSCLSLYTQLEAIGSELFYYTQDSSIVDQLMGRIGYHFEGVSETPGTFGTSAEGWKTHPHKYVDIPGPLESLVCADESSVFRGFDLDAWDATVPEERDSIEIAYSALWNCLHSDQAAALDALEESPIGGINSENLHDQWEDLCKDLMDEKRGYFEDEVCEAVDVANDNDFFGASMSPATLEEYKTCYLEAFMAYVDGLCFHPSPKAYRTLDTTISNINSPTPGAGIYTVETTPSKGGFVRYGGSEWAWYSKNGPAFTTATTESFDKVTDGQGIQVDMVTYQEPILDSAAYVAYANAMPSEAEMALLTAVGMGTTRLFFDSTNTDANTETIAFEDDTALVRSGIAASLPFNAIGPGSVGTKLPGWFIGHEGGGIPQVVGLGNNDYAVSLQCGVDSTGIVKGNGIFTEGAISLGNTHDEQYEFSARIQFDQGHQIDNLYLILQYPSYFNAPFLPENQGGEVLYPTPESNATNRFVAVHLTDVDALPSGDWKTVTQRFSVPQGQYWAYLYMKQEYQSEPVRILIDDIEIHSLHPCTLPATLLGNFDTWVSQPDTFEVVPCDQVVAQGLIDQFNGERLRILDHHDSTLVANYHRNCAPSDQLDIAYTLNYHHYTLYYYDPLGRLIRTVSPKGVDTTNETRQDVPDHTFVTEYAYNGLGNPVQSSTPDGGVVHTWYDRLQRPRFTQTAEDVAQDRFRYLCYDELDRLIRSGVSFLDGVDLNSQVDLTDWPEDDFDRTTTTDCAGCSERKYIVYDTPMDPMPARFDQTNLTNRISFTTNEEGDTTAYSYDAAGHVQSLYQHAELDAFGIPPFDNIIEYQNDNVTGMVHEMRMNEGREDQFYHRNTYDEDMRMTTASSSSDGIIWYDDVTLKYFPGGALKRHELGHYGVQGVDFTYNIHGQTIGINLPTENPEEDPGQDGHSSGDNPWFAPDIFAQQFNYYSGDFSRTGSLFSSGAARIPAHDYFDGNLSGVSWMQRTLLETGSDEPIVGRVYQVDELTRLQSASFSELQSGSWATSLAYNSAYSHDPNGNLLTLTRSDESGAGMDDLTYTYPSESNRLDHVTDALSTGTEDDVESQSPNNYTYDADGRLLADVAEGITEFYWRSGDKVDSLILTDGSKVRFRYDANGDRVAKITDDLATLYFRDAFGKTLAIYEYAEDTLALAEHSLINGRHIPSEPRSLSPIYTSTTLQRQLGQREHSIHDNVDNVRAVMSDLTMASEGSDGTITNVSPNMIASMDYAPYGSLLNARSINPSGSRYAFNGKEQDDEVKGGNGRHYDLGARHYDSRIGRMLSIDPRTEEYPWQSPYAYHANSPHTSVDFNGEGDDDEMSNAGPFDWMPDGAKTFAEDIPLENFGASFNIYSVTESTSSTVGAANQLKLHAKGVKGVTQRSTKLHSFGIDSDDGVYMDLMGERTTIANRNPNNPHKVDESFPVNNHSVKYSVRSAKEINPSTTPIHYDIKENISVNVGKTTLEFPNITPIVAPEIGWERGAKTEFYGTTFSLSTNIGVEFAEDRIKLVFGGVNAKEGIGYSSHPVSISQYSGIYVKDSPVDVMKVVIDSFEDGNSSWDDYPGW